MAKRKLEPVKKTRKGKKPGRRRVGTAAGVNKEVTKGQTKKGRPPKNKVTAISNVGLQYAANPDCESAEDLLQPLQKDGETVLEVECGTNKAHLYLSKLCQGSKGSCIEYDGSWLTPNEFQFVSGRESAKDWKRSIRHYEKSLKLLLSKGVIALHSNSCDCDGNCSRKIASKCPLGNTCGTTLTRGGKRRRGREADDNSSADDNSEGNDTDKDLSNSNDDDKDNDKSDDENDESDDNDDDDDDDDDDDESDSNETDGTEDSSENLAGKEESIDIVVKDEQTECDETLSNTLEDMADIEPLSKTEMIHTLEDMADIKDEHDQIYDDKIKEDRVCADDDDKSEVGLHVKCLNNNNNNNCVDITELLSDNTSNANASDNGILDEEIKGLVSELDIEIDDGEETEDYMDADDEDIISLVEKVGIKPLEKCDPDSASDRSTEPMPQDETVDNDSAHKLDIKSQFIHADGKSTSSTSNLNLRDRISGVNCDKGIAEASKTSLRRDGLHKEPSTDSGKVDSVENIDIQLDTSNSPDEHRLDANIGKHDAGNASGIGHVQPGIISDDTDSGVLAKTPRDHPAKPLAPVREYRLTSIIAQLRTRTIEADPNDPFAFTECDDEITCATSESSSSKKRSPGQKKSPAKKGAGRKKAAVPTGKRKAMPVAIKRQAKSRANKSTALSQAKKIENLIDFQPAETFQSLEIETPAYTMESKVEDCVAGNVVEWHDCVVESKTPDCVYDRLTDNAEYQDKSETGNSITCIMNDVYSAQTKTSDSIRLTVNERLEHLPDHNIPLEHLMEEKTIEHLHEPDSIIGTECHSILPDSLTHNSQEDMLAAKHTLPMESPSEDSFLSLMTGVAEHVGESEGEVSHGNRTNKSPVAEDGHADSLTYRVVDTHETDSIPEFDMRSAPEIPEPAADSEDEVSIGSINQNEDLKHLDQCQAAFVTHSDDRHIDELNKENHGTPEDVTDVCDQEETPNSIDITDTLKNQLSSTELTLAMKDEYVITRQALPVEQSLSNITECTSDHNMLEAHPQSDSASLSPGHDSDYNIHALSCPGADVYPISTHSLDTNIVLGPHSPSHSGAKCESVENESSQNYVVSLSAMCHSLLMRNVTCETPSSNSNAQSVVMETTDMAYTDDIEHQIARGIRSQEDTVLNVTTSDNALSTSVTEDIADALEDEAESQNNEHICQAGSPDEASQINTVDSHSEVKQEIPILTNIECDSSSPVCASDTIDHANTETINEKAGQIERGSEEQSTCIDSLDNTTQIQGTTKLLCSLMDINVPPVTHDSQLSPSTGLLKAEINPEDIASKKPVESPTRGDLTVSIETDNKQTSTNQSHTPVVPAIPSIAREGGHIHTDDARAFDERSTGSLIDGSLIPHRAERVAEMPADRTSSVLGCRPHDYYMPIASTAMEYKLSDSTLTSREPGEIIRNRKSGDSFENRDHVAQADLSAEIRKRVAAMLTGVTDESKYPNLDKNYRFIDRAHGDSKRDQEVCDVKKHSDAVKPVTSKIEVSSLFEGDNRVVSSNVSSSEKAKCINSEINHDFLSRSRKQMEQEAARFRQPRQTDGVAKSTDSEKRRTSTALGTYMDSILSAPNKIHTTSATARSHDTSGRAHSTSELSSSSWLRHTGQTHSDKQKTLLTDNKNNLSSSVPSVEKLKTSPTPNPLYDANYLSKYTAAEKRLREQSLLLLLHQQEKHYHQQMKMQQTLKDDALHKITSHRVLDKDRSHPYYHSTRQTVAAVKPRTKEMASEKKPTTAESRAPSSTTPSGATASQLQLPLGIPYAMSLPASVSEQLKLSGDAAKTNNYMNMLAAANLQYPMLMPSLTQQHDSSHAQQAVANMFPGLPYPYSMTPFYMPQMFTKEAAAAAAFLPTAMFPVFPSMPFLQSRMNTPGTTLPSTTSVLSPSSSSSFSSSLRTSPNVAKNRTSVTTACSPKLSSQTISGDKSLNTDYRSMTTKRKVSESELALDLSIKKHKHSQSAKPHIPDPSNSATRTTYPTPSASGALNMHRQSKQGDLASVREKSRSSSKSNSCYCSGLYPVHNWTVDEVCTFLCALDGCSVYVERFREHGVDGRILPLLTVDQLTHSLGMKLGPAVLLTQTVAKLLHLTSSMSCERCKAKETSHTPGSSTDTATASGYRGTGWSKLPGSVT